MLRGEFFQVADPRDGHFGGFEVMSYSIRGFGPFVIVLNAVGGTTLAGLSWRPRPYERFSSRSRLDIGIERFGYCVQFRDEGIRPIPGQQNMRARYITILQLIKPGPCT